MSLFMPVTALAVIVIDEPVRAFAVSVVVVLFVSIKGPRLNSTSAIVHAVSLVRLILRTG